MRVLDLKWRYERLHSRRAEWAYRKAVGTRNVAERVYQAACQALQDAYWQSDLDSLMDEMQADLTEQGFSDVATEAVRSIASEVQAQLRDYASEWDRLVAA
jgi:hypothetical protein